MLSFPLLHFAQSVTVTVIVALPSILAVDTNSEWLTADRSIVPAVQFGSEHESPTLLQRLERYRVPGVSIALIRSDQIAVLESIGVRDNSSAEPLEPGMQFQAASISKPVSATGVMVLVDQGEIDLDTPANDYLTGWIIPESAFTKGDPITLRELLSHTGGISVPSYPGFERGAELPSIESILEGAANTYSDPVSSIAPQGSYRYSGGGYMVLQKLIVDVTGKPFELFMHEAVFMPAGMKRSAFTIMSEPAGLVAGHDWQGKRRSDPWQDYPQAAPAGLWSTPEDLAHWLVAYGKAYRDEGQPVISPESAIEMARRTVANAGLGFGVHGEGESLHVSHAGWTIGYRSYVLYYPMTGEGVVIMTNSDSGHYLIDDLLRTLGREREWPGFGESISQERALWTDEKMEAVAGVYRMSPAGFTIELVSAGRSFELATPRGSVYSLAPISSDRLIIEETGDLVEHDPVTSTLLFWGMTASRLNDAETAVK